MNSHPQSSHELAHSQHQLKKHLTEGKQSTLPSEHDDESLIPRLLGRKIMLNQQFYYEIKQIKQLDSSQKIVTVKKGYLDNLISKLQETTKAKDQILKDLHLKNQQNEKLTKRCMNQQSRCSQLEKDLLSAQKHLKERITILKAKEDEMRKLEQSKNKEIQGLCLKMEEISMVLCQPFDLNLSCSNNAANLLEALNSNNPINQGNSLDYSRRNQRLLRENLDISQPGSSGQHICTWAHKFFDQAQKVSILEYESYQLRCQIKKLQARLIA